jgi:hypothetical protein
VLEILSSISGITQSDNSIGKADRSTNINDPLRSSVHQLLLEHKTRVSMQSTVQYVNYSENVVSLQTWTYLSGPSREPRHDRVLLKRRKVASDLKGKVMQKGVRIPVGGE